MEKTFAPESIEKKWYDYWESNQLFAPQSAKAGQFCMMLPPPNVTGSLHMGHGFQHTLMDAVTRYQRMDGKRSLWQPGTDHAGISTQLVVEKRLMRQGISRQSLGRKDFIDEVWAWKTVSADHITSQMRRFGSSVDWTRERFTLDKGFSEAVTKAFVELHQQGLIYRGKRLVNWCPHLQTAISDLEVETSEEDGWLWFIAYAVEGHPDITIATTRPETLFGDVAIAVHPEDERYQDMIGKFATLPISGRKIPIIADDFVDLQFGTGCVKVTPAHDFNDYEVGKRHQLPLINIFNPDATLNQTVPSDFVGLDRFAARKQLIAALEQSGQLVKTVKHRLAVPLAEKSGQIIEPLLTNQWYVAMSSLVQPAVDAVKQGRIKFFPQNWEKTFFQWMENVEDWCISRQLWWGHQIPAWYDDDGKVYIGYSEEDVRFRYRLAADQTLTQDPDVLDTWFSSALWPFATLGWPAQTEAFREFFPTDLLITGFDIIFFWVARMIMFSLKFTQEIPFKTVYVTGLIQDNDGSKMSKSKGNVLDPIDIIDGISFNALLEKRTKDLMLDTVKQTVINNTKRDFPQGIDAYGTDALRFTYCALATPGRDIKFDIGRVHGYRNFCNKLWNASRYVIQQTEHMDDLGDGPFQYSPQDQWILSKTQSVIRQARAHFDNYRFDLLASDLYEFVWHEYCDWYLELSKPVLYDEDCLPALKRGAQKTLLHVLENIVLLLHPIVPFITEELWHKLHKLISDEEHSIMINQYPCADDDQINPEIEQEFVWLKSLIQSVRTLRSETHLSPGKRLKLITVSADNNDRALCQKYLSHITQLCGLDNIQCFEEKPSLSYQLISSTLLNNMELILPLDGLIDVHLEIERLEKEILKVTKLAEKSRQKLANQRFIAQAPADVVDQEKQRLASSERQRMHLQQRLDNFQQT